MSWRKSTQLRDAIGCLASANLYFLTIWRSLIVPPLQYHMQTLPSALDFAIVIANVLAVALVMYAALAAARRWAGQRVQGAVVLVYLTSLFVMVTRAYALDQIWPNRLNFVTMLIVACGLLAIWARPPAMPKFFQSAGLCLLPCLAITAWHSAEAFFLRPVHSASAPAPVDRQDHRANAARTALIIFDMLDYDLLFDHRMADLHVPEFDRLRSESYFARNATSPNLMTQEALPSLTTGKVVTHTQAIATDDLLLSIAGVPQAISWKLQPTIFSEARDAGMVVGLTGWYHPYCRLFAEMLTSCAWVAIPERLSAKDSTAWGTEQAMAWVMMDDLAGPSLANVFRLDQYAGRKYIEAYQHALQEAGDVLTNGALDLAVVHMPIPHTPAIYDRSTQQFTTETGDYIDNLALADRTLGILRRRMEEAGLWDTTNILITADHGLRIKGPAEWNHSLTPLHVPFILKMSGSAQHVEDDHRFNTIRVHDIVLAALKKELVTTDQAQAFLDKDYR